MLLGNTFRAFRHRDYAIFWLGLLLGHTGTLMQTTAQSWLLFQLTNSPFYLGLEGFCLGLPRVLFSAFGGAMVDRADRKSIFVATQVAFLLMALFLGVMTAWGAIQVWHLLVVSALTGFLVSFEQPVRQSILHSVVPTTDLPNGIALYQMVFNGSMLFGPSIGGLLIPWIGTEGCFFTATGGNLIVLLSIFLMRIPKTHRPAPKKSLAQETIEGFSLAWHTPIFLALFTTLGIVTFCTKPYTQFMPVFARDILDVGAPGLGLLLMAPGAGAILGGLTLASIRRFPRPHRLLFFLAAGFGASILLFATSRDFRLSLLWLFFAGGFQTTFLSSTAALLQIHADETNRGRIMSLFGLINRGLGPMGSLPFGMVASASGAPVTVAACGILTVGAVAYTVIYRSPLRRAKAIGEI
ncbi:MAG TPA: MFS transporter [Candidatus Binatia bacterium]|nr:MFS transporter [Candidatus Binatia bacterium]